MKREILLRWKRVDNGEWVEGLPCYDSYGCISRIEVCGMNSAQEGVFEVNPETVGQFTGLLDKNGVRIFEGSIVKLHYGSNYSVEYVQELSLYSICRPIGRVASYPFLDFNRCEVIGNIHDNLELLN